MPPGLAVGLVVTPCASPAPPPAGPLTGLIASGYIRLIGWVTHHAATGRAAIIAPVAAFGIPSTRHGCARQAPGAGRA
jgi:hypothetical protein